MPEIWASPSFRTKRAAGPIRASQRKDHHLALQTRFKDHVLLVTPSTRDVSQLIRIGRCYFGSTSAGAKTSSGVTVRLQGTLSPNLLIPVSLGSLKLSRHEVVRIVHSRQLSDVDQMYTILPQHISVKHVQETLCLHGRKLQGNTKTPTLVPHAMSRLSLPNSIAGHS